ncbi:MAG: PQQ-binding-like beta-propeller repeat protein, partial [Candidatus Wallbacteria bacterium]|nr:PQQ-binding-like beta-propeller repeat protein [Candidatus Wallbacteria bacterium]
VFDAVTTSPLLLGDRIYIPVWYADNRPFRPRQKSEVVCLDAKTGAILWRTALGSSNLFSAASAVCDGKDILYVTSADGNLYGMSADTGALLWKFTTCMDVNSSPAVVRLPDGPIVCFGTIFGLYYGINGRTGDKAWVLKLGLNSIYPGACGLVDGRMLLFVPNFDRHLYCIDPQAGEILWRFATGKYIASCPVLTKISGRPAVVFPSLDNILYAVDASTGAELWRYQLGDKLWAYDTRGLTLWPSPSCISYEGKPLLIVPWYDGNIYAFSDPSQP